MKPLEGIRVVDFTVSVAGPLAGLVLAELGAEVIKVEEAATRRALIGDMPLRPGAPDRPYNRNSHFNELNREKLSVSINVGAPKGRDLFLRLAGIADIVIENFSPQVVGKLGIDYEQVRTVKPDIIYLSMPAFGKSGPYADLRSYGPGIDAMSGLSHLTGYLGGQPLKPGNFYCDQNAGLHTAFAALSALYYRRQSGVGQYIEVPMLEGELQVIGEAIMDVALNGREQTRIGNRHPSIAPHGVYPCSGENQWLTIVAKDGRQWQSLCRSMGREDLMHDKRFVDPIARYQHQDELDSIIAAWTVHQEKRAVQELLQAAGVSAGAALAVDELFEDPQIRAREGFQFVDHPESGPFPHTRVAFRLSDTPAPVSRSGPLFAAAGDYVFHDLLKLSQAEIEALAQEGIIHLDRQDAIRRTDHGAAV
ncbi:MAG: CaiB/BaiF CoA transferase family protein [Dehalococcoidia bacterium]